MKANFVEFFGKIFLDEKIYKILENFFFRGFLRETLNLLNDL